MKNRILQSFTLQIRNDPNADTIVISETIVEHTIVEENGEDTVGGDIISIADLMGDLLHVHRKKQEIDYENNTMLTNNILNTTNHLVSSSFGWEEIIDNYIRYETSSNLLSITDSVSYMLFHQSQIPRTHNEASLTNSISYNFKASNLTVNSIFWKDKTNLPSSPFCYTFDQSSICLPETSYDDILSEKEIIEVSVQYKVDPNSFPSDISKNYTTTRTYTIQEIIDETNSSLNTNLISLSVNNGTTGINISPIHPIIITFNHEPTEVSLTHEF